MDNPAEYLRRYIRSHHRALTLMPVRAFGKEHGVELDATVMLKSGEYKFRLMLPRNAPEDARPLCTSVYVNGKQIWSFNEDHLPHVGLQKKTRVHLHEIAADRLRQYMLVDVREGTPDIIVRVSRVDDESFSYLVEALLKQQLARLWGMKARYSKDEKRALERAMEMQKKD